MPSVILLDWMLPEISGIEICKLVRSKPDIKNIPIIMLTAKKPGRRQKLKVSEPVQTIMLQSLFPFLNLWQESKPI